MSRREREERRRCGPRPAVLRAQQPHDAGGSVQVGGRARGTGRPANARARAGPRHPRVLQETAPPKGNPPLGNRGHTPIARPSERRGSAALVLSVTPKRLGAVRRPDVLPPRRNSRRVLAGPTVVATERTATATPTVRRVATLRASSCRRGFSTRRARRTRRPEGRPCERHLSALAGRCRRALGGAGDRRARCGTEDRRTSVTRTPSGGGAHPREAQELREDVLGFRMRYPREDA